MYCHRASPLHVCARHPNGVSPRRLRLPLACILTFLPAHIFAQAAHHAILRTHILNPPLRIVDAFGAAREVAWFLDALVFFQVSSTVKPRQVQVKCQVTSREVGQRSRVVPRCARHLGRWDPTLADGVLDALVTLLVTARCTQLGKVPACSCTCHEM